MSKCHCGKYACFNLRGESKGRYCTEHKKSYMVIIKNKTCEADGCEKKPIYNVRGETKGRFCAEHKEPFMVIYGINIKK